MQQLSLIKESIETFQAILTCGALIAGGAWTYYTYIYKREKVPRALIEPVALSFLSSEGIYISVSIGHLEKSQPSLHLSEYRVDLADQT
jgi:hypothetical protein